MAIRNLIFDLGGVLFAIDVPRAFSNFQALIPPAHAAQNPKNLIEIAHHAAFNDFETGLLSPAEFRDALRAQYGVQGSDAQIDAAWNSLLIGVIPGRVAALQTLARDYRLVLLSNTNQIHAEQYAQEVQPLFACFEHTFLSFEMGLRKPDPEIYSAVLKSRQMTAKESIFIDDNSSNLEGAQKIGMGTFLVDDSPGHHFEDFLQHLSMKND